MSVDIKIDKLIPKVSDLLEVLESLSDEEKLLPVEIEASQWPDSSEETVQGVVTVTQGDHPWVKSRVLISANRRRFKD